MGREERIAAITTALGILVSVGGRMLATSAQLPFWLDSLGTFFVAYMLGPIPGAVAGLSSNIIFALLNRGSFVFGLTSIAIGLVVGTMAKRGYFKTLFGTLTVGSATALAASVISFGVCLAIADGRTGNMWGDGVIDYFTHIGVPGLISSFIGVFYLDFVDKMLVALLLFGVVQLMHRAMKRFGINPVHAIAANQNEADDEDQGEEADGEADGEDQGAKAPRKEIAAKGGVALLLVAMLLVSAPANAQAKTQTAGEVDFYSFVQEVYGYNTGLSCGEANDIAQTKDGVMWIGTYAGLYRYNGREFRLMGHFDSVKNVNCLYVDEEGRLWIGTNDQGLSMCVEEHVRNVIDTSVGLSSNSVRAIVRCSDGKYYVGTTNALDVFELAGGINMQEEVTEVLSTKSLSADERGHVAAVTSAGDLFVLKEGKVVMQSRLPAEDGAGSYTCCLFDRYGRLIVGTSKGSAFLYDISQGTFQNIKEYVFEGIGEIKSIMFTEDGLLFACADNGVGAFTSAGDYEAIHTGSFNNSIDHGFVDYQGNYWFTSSRLGVLKMTKSTFSDLFEMADLERDVVNTSVMWQDLLYVGTDEGLVAIDLASGDDQQNDLTRSLEGTRIRCAKVDSRDHLWLCTYGKGLLDVAPDGSIKAYDATDDAFTSRVRTCIELQDGTILASGDSKVVFIRDDAVQKSISYGGDFSSAQVLCFYQLEDGTVLCGTDGNGIVALKDDRVVWRTTADDGLSSNVVMRIVPSASGKGYYAVMSNGLCLLQADGSAKALDNFPYFNNFDIYPGDSGELFVLSSAGIFVVDEDELVAGNDPLSADVLDARSGLGASITANSWNYADQKGMLYISTDQGVYRLNTHDYAETKHLYHMKVSSITVDGVEYNVERGTTFPLNQDASRIDINAEVISYTVDDPMVAYRLEGYDTTDTIVRKSELGVISYTNIAPGDYAFRMAVLSADGSIVEEARYPLHKDPMIYDNLWFMFYVFVVAGAAIAWFAWFLAHLSAQRRFEAQQRELELARKQVEMADVTVLSIARAVDAKDENTSQHSHRVSQYSVLLARELGFSEDECENLRKAALLHDIGKIGIPDRILNKPARLTDEEYAIMKTHVSRGAEILKDFTMIDHVVEGALYHHERYDGRGYVNGLAGEQIPLYGRIISVADAFDAMTQNRVYRHKQDLGYVLGELEKGKGTQFDPQIATIMLRLIDEGKIDHILYSTNEDETDKEAGE